MTEKELERLLSDAKADKKLKEALLNTRKSEDPVEEFCGFARKNGYEIYAGELIALGQNENDAKLRSVNGGGVDPIEGWDDAYEQFFMTLIWTG